MDETPADLETLAALDFRVECSMTHGGKPCTREATHLVTIHQCLTKTGHRVPVCSYFVRATEVVPYPVKCERCMKIFNDRYDYVWSIETL